MVSTKSSKSNLRRFKRPSKGVKEMFKSIIKIFLPNSKKIAGYAAESIAKAINSQTEREAQIAKYAKLAD